MGGAVPDFIRQQYLAKFALVVILVIGLVGVGGYAMVSEASNTLESQQRSQVVTNAELNADQTAKWVSNYRQTVRILSKYQSLRERDYEGAQAELRSELERLPPEVSEIHYVIIDESVGSANSTSIGGPITASTDESEVGNLFQSHGATWQEPLASDNSNETQVSYVYEHDGVKQVAFASRVEGTRRALILTVNASSHADSFRTGIEGSNIQIVNQDGTVEFDNDPDQVLTSYRYGSSFVGVKNAKDGEAGVTRMESDGLLVAYAPVPDTNWVLVNHTPISSAYSVVDSIRQNVLLVIGISLAGFVFIGMTIGRSTVNSLTRLSAKARKLEQGNLDVDVESERADEIGQLYSAFGEMRDGLKQQIEEAQQARKKAEVSRAETMEMYNILQAKADDYSEVMRKCAEGDMTQRMSVDGESEEMDHIAIEFNGMMEELEKTTGQLETFAEEVGESGEIVLQNAESVRDASEQVATSIQTISDDTYLQQEQLQDLTEDIDELLELLEQVQSDNPDADLGGLLERFRTVETTLQEAAETSEAILSEAEGVAGAAEEQAAELNEVSSRADRLKRYARPLSDILGRFETNAEHEFVFSGGPSAPQPQERDD